ncbi:uncharacterized protein A1O9_02891 [Exophiala aquamarina CBS 119918]|uniref:Carboxylesterase type B domain-containing protein n=1 Tax=Exophiala aquamarina CBS 119918 TaxID=1182545 RepID=A0A072PN85_9EURO|nr:uncharacterized protein A1O9_02891 [Exophiala aquamarina CBS 119918]KEF61326.1 hypothetical protein A1O9_02891 [Exophiala aquamarina CBS 119918]
MSHPSMEKSKAPYAGPKYTHAHPDLGELTGRMVELQHFSEAQVVQFRSIPFASIPKRFLPSVKLGEIPQNFDERPYRDFTDFGAGCPQTGASNPAWWLPQGGPLADDLGLTYNEFTCLTLSISAPVANLTLATRSRLPVMVYVHGGGLAEGVGHVDGLHSNASIASYASSISQPVIVVNIGYRLNWFGGLVCQDLLDEYATNNNQGQPGPFNLFLQDQRNAFAWIQKFIGGFGGDVSNITAFGESAGSVSLTYHICGSAARLFDRAILQSGVIMGDTSFEAKEKEYQDMLKHFKIVDDTPGERLNKLRQIDVAALAQYPGIFMCPFVGSVPGVSEADSLFARGPPTVANQIELIATCQWLGDVIVGDVFWEGDITLPGLRHRSHATLVETITTIFPRAHAEAVLAAYELDISKEIDENRAWSQTSKLMGDLIFSAEIERLTKRLGLDEHRKIYRYSFGLSNPIPGSLHSFATGHHFIDILFLFLTLIDRYPTHRNNYYRGQAIETARRWISFAHGQAPWEAYTTKSDGVPNAKIAICNDLVGWTTRTIAEDEEISKNDPWGPRRYGGLRAIIAALDALRSAEVSEEMYCQKTQAIKLFSWVL